MMLTKVLTTGAMLTALALAGCSDSGTNQSCTSNCFQMNGIDNDSPADLDAKIKKMCESMGRKGTPQVKERSKTAVAGYCPE
jgi:hypothetical protein